MRYLTVTGDYIMKWITRERPKIDRIACPWLIKRFIDPQAVIVFVAKENVLAKAKQIDGIPFDIANVEYTHYGNDCTFDYFLKKHELNDPALKKIADIVRGADTDQFTLAPEAAGLWAISAGLSYNYKNDYEQLDVGLKLYDALYSWAKFVSDERHTWKPE
jgi:hypothetical protein